MMNISSSIIFILIILIYCQLGLSLSLRSHSFITSKKLHHHHLYYKKTLNRYNYNNYHLYSNSNDKNINQLDGSESTVISNKNSIFTKIANFFNIFFTSKKTTKTMINKEAEKINKEAEKKKTTAKKEDNVMVCKYLNYIIFIFFSCIIIFILI